VTPLPAPAPSPTPEADGWLLVLVKPWADIAIDNKPAGQTPRRRVPLRPGAHDVLLSHPDYLPFRRRVTIGPGETFNLNVDLTREGVRRAR
jgi:hypothetical protein